MAVRFVQPMALKIERLRAGGVTDEELLARVRQGDLSEWKQLGDFTMLLEFAEERMQDLERGITEGYEITFTTINGIRNLLAIKYGLQAGEDYTDDEESLENIPLNAEQVAWLRGLVKNWNMAVAEEGHVNIRL